jgi:hypothetical protein
MPQYRLAAQPGQAHVVYLGMVDRPGRVVEWVGWPTPWMEPVDEAAKRIADYVQRNGSFKPHSPIDQASGTYYLPAGGLRDGDGILPAMPIYRSASPFEWQGRSIAAGVPLCWLSWPTWVLDPVNEAAHRVRAYWERHHRDTRLPRSPWNEFDDSLWLPELLSRAASPRQPFAPSDMLGQPLAPDDFGIGRMGARR